jgi:hypothetical protein
MSSSASGMLFARTFSMDNRFSAQSDLCRLRRLICNQIHADCVDLSAIKSMQIA